MTFFFLWIGLGWKQLVEISYTARSSGPSSIWNHPGASRSCFLPDVCSWRRTWQCSKHGAASRCLLSKGQHVSACSGYAPLHCKPKQDFSGTCRSLRPIHSSLPLRKLSCSTFLPCFPASPHAGVQPGESTAVLQSRGTPAALATTAVLLWRWW